MHRLLKAFLFKIKRDLTFKITLGIGLGCAILTTVALAMVDEVDIMSGQNMLLVSLSPIQNFGIALPVNLISFICLEFTQGSIRNKIIAGNSKLKIYLSLVVSGLVFLFGILIGYALLCTFFGCILSGFNFSKKVMLIGTLIPELGTATGIFLLKYVCISFAVYLSICMMTIFIATSFRNIGPSIPIVIIVMLLGYLGTMILVAINGNNQALMIIFRIINPFFGLVSPHIEGETFVISNLDFFSSLGCNIGWAILFLVLGCIEFSKRDVK